MKNNITEQAVRIVTIIDEYYDASFKIGSEKCMPFILELIEQLALLLGMLDNNKQQKLNVILGHMMSAMEIHDGVLLRDILQYDLRTFMTKNLN